MQYKTRKMVKPEDLNPANTLFGGRALAWIDEEAAIFATCKLDTNRIVTVHMGEINFLNPGFQNDIIEIGVEVVAVGISSITLSCILRNKSTGKHIVAVEKIVFVAIGEDGRSMPHGKKTCLEEQMECTDAT